MSNIIFTLMIIVTLGAAGTAAFILIPKGVPPIAFTIGGAGIGLLFVGITKFINLFRKDKIRALLHKWS